MVDLQHPIIGRLRLALANGRGLQAGAEDVVALAACLGMQSAKDRSQRAAIEVAAACLPAVEIMRGIAYGTSKANDETMRNLAALAMVLLGEA